MRRGIALIVGAAFAAACGGMAADTAGTDVRLHDFGIDLARTSFDAGEVTFRLANEGPSVHEFVIVRSDTEPGSLPVVENEVDEAALDAVDEVEDVAVGATPTLTVDLAPGSYIVFCNITGHYAAGMHAGFTVS